MARLAEIKGMRQVLAKMTWATSILAKKVERGLKDGGLFVLRESKKICPIAEGNLRGDADTFVKPGTSGIDTDVIVAYYADYAVYVHEDLDARHNPPTRAKFLEAIFREQKSELFKVVAGDNT